MTKAIKLKNNTYWDSTTVVHNKKNLNDVIDGLIIYSTEEQIIGTWFGKTLYRKGFQINNQLIFNNNKYTFNHNISNIDIVVDCYGTLYDTLNKTYYRIPYVARGTNDIMCYANNTQVTIEQNPYGNRLNNVNIFLEYTKTTD